MNSTTAKIECLRIAASISDPNKLALAQTFYAWVSADAETTAPQTQEHQKGKKTR